MNKKKKKNVEMTANEKIRKTSRNETEDRNQFRYIMLFAFGLLLFFLVLIKGEHFWKFLHNFVFGMFGFLAFFVGIATMIVAVLFSSKIIKKGSKAKVYQFVALFIFLCAQIQTYSFEETAGVNLFRALSRAFKFGVFDYSGGGVFGEIVSFLFRSFLGKKAAIVLIWIILFVLLLILTSTTLFGFLKILFKPVKKVETGLKNFKISNRFNIDVPIEEEEELKEEKKEEPLDVMDNLNFFKEKKDFYKENSISKEAEKQKDLEKKTIKKDINISKPVQKEEKVVEPKIKIEELVERASKDFSEKFIDNLKDSVENRNFEGYCFPSPNLLDSPEGKSNLDVSSELKTNAARLVDTLKSFGVETRITDICRGPSVTRYELQPCAGVKISKITNLADDISLNLASGGVRIEAPVPNKAAVGIEVPNKEKEIVYLKEVIMSKEFQNSKNPLTFALGKDIAGNVKIANIAKMPHILIAGATGSGKSVCVNSLIVSILYKSSPSDVRLLMIDPKVVELGVYNRIPHLLVPVVTEPKKASGALSWAVSEMKTRYNLFAKTGVREMKSYNLLVESGKTDSEGNPYKKMPHIVIIIDELADLMMASMSREVENSICKLAQMARAAGMHLVIATQRPSVDVITGLIKANIPSRIAFTVSSQVDSRTIIDVAGAEKLLGKGDMLYYPIDEQNLLECRGVF